ncbi:probable disease resistance protein At5g66900 [Macadamia integrifolia]|uniref:probable disease resistance protein At5g66900 n=1 Tax=Macadamia integrifolia TaxID=60698 RepID=UPI001C5010BD|nr:probable disease resistance protein At5g66900 [Macadamia integrifolia]
MAEAIILGALAQEVLQEVVRVILHMKGKTFNFREDLEELRISLEYVVPILKQGWKLNSELDFSKPEGVEKFKEKLQKGKELVSRCYKIPSWNIIQRIRYASKISKFDETIRRFCGLELQVENWRDNKVLLQTMNEMALHQVPSLSTINKGLFAVPQLPNHLVGFDIAIRELKIELFKENVTVLGVCAPGGCGKSTLAAMLCRDEEVRVAFRDKILFLTVSRNPILKILQRLIEEIGNGVSRSDLSEEDAIKQFHYLLEERRSQPLLLVLDDVWEESIIEKVFSRNKGCKMLVTSREAFKVYNSENHSKYLLKTLNPQDSKSLFRQTSLSQDGNDEYKPDENLLNEIVKNCEGFPLAITVIAKSLSQQPAVKWSNMAKKLSNGASIFNIDEKLQKCLATSLEFLDATLLECFMDLGSFPEDKRISASALIDIWCERYELDSEDEAYFNLLELASRNLVNLVGNRYVCFVYLSN